MTKRVLSLTEMVALRKKLRRQGKKVVFTNGVFDILHVGHLSLLEKSKDLGDILIVGLNSDASTRRLKGNSRPLVPFKDRARLLASIRPVDYVVGFSQDTPLQLIKKLLPDILVKGADYKISEIVGAKEVTDAGGKVVRVRLLAGRSTSKLVELL
ncbi:MAG: D-glycero-beta-D-manno-heptose 1-phosphate adenylyltransferase [candidate division Zixibacteria bacterium]|nr:D-glycero-beta-D-manno-heptose 1-phosphate adenylyltransferase [candidate division Zixibacteria bacterium]MBU1469815.1 D-glycero-beta-D-manno-heptose 1-phosphate adenylyltransferase [candidate division Zixibacteria bacterium]